jgi:hypothetical protein
MVLGGMKGSTVQGREWRCTCGSLLGMRSGDALHIKYKEFSAVLRGTASVRCRRCGSHNEARLPTIAAA